jgi:hypothetical protein
MLCPRTALNKISLIFSDKEKIADRYNYIVYNLCEDYIYLPFCFTDPEHREIFNQMQLQKQ